MAFLRIDQGQSHGGDQQHIGGLVGINGNQRILCIEFGLHNDGSTHKHAGQQTFNIPVDMVER